MVLKINLKTIVRKYDFKINFKIVGKYSLKKAKKTSLVIILKFVYFYFNELLCYRTPILLF